MLEGKPLDWDLQLQVALIDEDVWDAGPKAVAERIARIEADWRRDADGPGRREPRYEPKDVVHLFEAPKAVSTGMFSVAAMITQEFESFRAQTGLNETPEMFLPLERVPAKLVRIGELVSRAEPDAATEQALREEIGRLNATIAELECALRTKQADNLWRRAAGMTIAGAGLFAFLSNAIWVVSGDDLGPRKRLDNLLQYRDFFLRSGTEIQPTSPTPKLPKAMDV